MLLNGVKQDEDILFGLNVQQQEDRIDLYQHCWYSLLTLSTHPHPHPYFSPQPQSISLPLLTSAIVITDQNSWQFDVLPLSL